MAASSTSPLVNLIMKNFSLLNCLNIKCCLNKFRLKLTDYCNIKDGGQGQFSSKIFLGVYLNIVHLQMEAGGWRRIEGKSPKLLLTPVPIGNRDK
jgi:hypothetical protein